MATLQQMEYGGWPRALRFSDGRTEVVVTTEVGPRILLFALCGGRNVLFENPRDLGAVGGSRWRIYGGHRLWIAPEHRRRTYVPDNDPVAWRWSGGTLLLRQTPERTSGLQKELRLRYLPGGTLRIEHIIANRGRRAVELAPWSLSVMAPGGRAVFPQEPYGSHVHHLLPARPIVLWRYTDMNDPRWTWGRRLIEVRQDARLRRPQKFGLSNGPGWMAYVLRNEVFVKRHRLDRRARYPDLGCNAECFVNGDILELETLGPLTLLRPGDAVRHLEHWGLHRARVRARGEAPLVRALGRLVARVAEP